VRGEVGGEDPLIWFGMMKDVGAIVALYFHTVSTFVPTIAKSFF
jgi:hypothetical protein